MEFNDPTLNEDDYEIERTIDIIFLTIYVTATLIFCFTIYKTFKHLENRTLYNVLVVIYIMLTLLSKI